MADQPIVHLKCTRTDRVYRVIGFDPVSKVLTLKGKNGIFTEPMRPVKEFQEIGYERIIGPFEGMIPLE